jgi:hypothetical protein
MADQEVRNVVTSEGMKSFIKEQVETIACNTLPDILRKQKPLINDAIKSAIQGADSDVIANAVIKLIRNLNLTKNDVDEKDNEEEKEEKKEGETSGGSKRNKKQLRITRKKKVFN